MYLGGITVHKYRWSSKYYLSAKRDTIDTLKESVQNLEAMKCTGCIVSFRPQNCKNTYELNKKQRAMRSKVKTEIEGIIKLKCCYVVNSVII